MNRPASGQGLDCLLMKRQHLTKAVAPLGVPATAWLMSTSFEAGNFYTESLKPIIEQAVQSWNENCANSEWSSTLLAEAKQVQSLSTLLHGPPTSTGYTSAGASMVTASARKRANSDTEDTASSGSESDTSTESTKETFFYIYKNKDGHRSKHSAKGKIVWKNSYKLNVTLTKKGEDGPKIYYNASSMINKTTDLAMVNQVEMMRQWFQERAATLKEKKLLKREKLPTSNYSPRSYGKSWRGNYHRG